MSPEPVEWHMLGRRISGDMPKAWTSKKDKGPVYSNITDPKEHLLKLYPKEVGLVSAAVKAGKKGYGLLLTCFCCDPSKMTLKDITKPK